MLITLFFNHLYICYQYIIIIFIYFPPPYSISILLCYFATIQEKKERKVYKRKKQRKNNSKKDLNKITPKLICVNSININNAHKLKKTALTAHFTDRCNIELC